MCKRTYCAADINDELLEYADKYLKKVIVNAKKKYFIKKLRFGKSEIHLVPIEDCEEELVYIEHGYDKAECRYIRIGDINIAVHDPIFYQALVSLTEVQRAVLLEKEVLGIPLQQIATEHCLCLSSVKKHKHNAIDKIRRYMKDYEYEHR